MREGLSRVRVRGLDRGQKIDLIVIQSALLLFAQITLLIRFSHKCALSKEQNFNFRKL